MGVLTSGLRESLTHDENLDLWRLAKSAEARPAVRDVILATPGLTRDGA